MTAEKVQRPLCVLLVNSLALGDPPCLLPAPSIQTGGPVCARREGKSLVCLRSSMFFYVIFRFCFCFPGQDYFC